MVVLPEYLESFATSLREGYRPIVRNLLSAGLDQAATETVLRSMTTRAVQGLDPMAAETFLDLATTAYKAALELEIE
jgi:hypothetical protein